MTLFLSTSRTVGPKGLHPALRITEGDSKHQNRLLSCVRWRWWGGEVKFVQAARGAFSHKMEDEGTKVAFIGPGMENIFGWKQRRYNRLRQPRVSIHHFGEFASELNQTLLVCQCRSPSVFNQGHYMCATQLSTVIRHQDCPQHHQLTKKPTESSRWRKNALSWPERWMRRSSHRSRRKPQEFGLFRIKRFETLL